MMICETFEDLLTTKKKEKKEKRKEDDDDDDDDSNDNFNVCFTFVIRGINTTTVWKTAICESLEVPFW